MRLHTNFLSVSWEPPIHQYLRTFNKNNQIEKCSLAQAQEDDASALPVLLLCLYRTHDSPETSQIKGIGREKKREDKVQPALALFLWFRLWGRLLLLLLLLLGFPRNPRSLAASCTHTVMRFSGKHDNSFLRKTPCSRVN